MADENELKESIESGLNSSSELDDTLDDIISGAGELDDILNRAKNSVFFLGEGFSALAGEVGAANALTFLFTKTLMDIDDQATDLVSGFGQVRGFSNAIQDTFIEINREVFNLDVQSEEILEVFRGFNTELGRMVLFTADEGKRMLVLSEATGLASFEIGSMIAKMSDLGMGTLTAISNIEKMTVEAQKLGLNVNTFIKDIGDNIKLVNQYGFDKGINGLAKMVAKAQLLRFDIQQAVDIADGILDGGPEKAVELATELAVLGGDIGELGDPFAMMFNSINDVGSIQDSLIDLASAAATVNEETGQIEIPAQARLRLRQQAKALNVSFEELADAAINSKRQMMALEDLRISGVENLSEEDQQFIASMSEINERGEMVVKLMHDGDVREIKLTDASGLEGAMEDLRKQQEMSDADPKDVLRKNTEAMVSLSESIDKLTSKEALLMLGAGAFDSQPVRDVIQGLKDSVVGLKTTMSETSASIGEIFKDGEVTDEEAKTLFSDTTDKLIENAKSFGEAIGLSDKAIQKFLDALTNAAKALKGDGEPEDTVPNEADSEVINSEPIEASGEVTDTTPIETADDFILRPGRDPILYNKDDLIIGGTNLFDNSKGQNYEAVNMIPSVVEKQSSIIESIQNNLTTTQRVEQTMSVKDINVNVNGTISVTDRNGNMVDILRNPDVKNQIVMVVKDAFERGNNQFV